jgi:hypothetical protein
MSTLALYHRVGSGQKNLPWVLRTKVVWTIVVAMTAFSATMFLVGDVSAGYQGFNKFKAELFACMPVSQAWDIRYDGTDCINLFDFAMAQGSIKVFVDLILSLYPLPLLGILKINGNQRGMWIASSHFLR